MHRYDKILVLFIDVIDVIHINSYLRSQSFIIINFIYDCVNGVCDNALI
jgi:hypothetical protein